ncbi:UDP-glucose 4-epimerase [Thermosyntropha lipolytica DSM 11003]|uniref:UDP-glucose 4-epimerase n=1 Tax=Thermosyntropha lipolytica DSM 11003 TaxID=1123382 RepID=A0A1M5PCE9_9FIRM|nr:NAD-dependent epimerase/dehydratase family protein [Thermosyntropha lipolytica]SHG98903.1 UDP-glucose 4-epimerase [Thermosyntropha lipolytica DSM 11003]
MEKKTVVVTGGAGFIGSHLTDYLVRKDYEVIVVDNLSAGSIENLPRCGKIYFYQKDVRDETLARIYDKYKPGLLFHLAAHYANELSIKEPVYDLRINAEGTLVQLKLAVKTRSIRRFVYASTSCVYLPSFNPLKEDSPLKPHTPYGISKLAGEYYTLFYGANYGLPFTIIRYFNVYGSKEPDSMYRGVIAKFVAAAVRAGSLFITGNGEEVRDFTYVEDAVKGTILAAFSSNGINQVFNIGTGTGTTIREVADIISRLKGQNISVEYQERRKWDQTIYRVADISKARSWLGYEPGYSLYNGLKLTLDWYEKNLTTDRKNQN